MCDVTWTFNVYMNSCIRKMKGRVGELCPRLKMSATGKSLVAGLFADDTLLLAESERLLQWIVVVFDRVHKTQKLKMLARVRSWYLIEQQSRPILPIQT